MILHFHDIAFLYPNYNYNNYIVQLYIIIFIIIHNYT